MTIFTLTVEELLNKLTDEERTNFFEYVATEEEVIKAVADQIYKGWTDNYYRGTLKCTASADPCIGLDYARRIAAKHVAADEIKRLEEALAYREKELDEIYSKYRLVPYSSEV